MDYDDYLKTGTMPPPIESDEERERRRIASAGGVAVMPPVPVRPSAVAGTPTMPNSRGFSAAAMDAARGNARLTSEASDPNSRDLFQRAAASARPQVGAANTPEGTPRNALPPVPVPSAVGATVRPIIPPLKLAEPPVAPDLGGPKLPPVPLRVDPGTPGRPASFGDAVPPQPAIQPLPAVPLGPAQQRFQELTEKGPPKPNWWQRALEIAGSLHPFGRLIESQIPSTPLGYNTQLNAAAVRAAKKQSLQKGEQEAETAREQARFSTPEKREAYMQQQPEQFEGMSDFEKNDWRVTGKFPQREPGSKTERPENLDREAYDYYVSQGMTPADARKHVLQDAQSVKPERQTHTSPFEAFAYGDPQEKKAAQDYLEFERKVGARYRTPSEFDERYRLFKEDPDAYRAMFGDKDKSGTPDRATARAMLNYFDRRRREINQDFTLDDAQKQEQLKDIENLEKPFMDAVQPGRTDRGGEDRVNVIGPDGTPGTVPRSQLEKAKKKGYREAQ